MKQKRKTGNSKKIKIKADTAAKLWRKLSGAAAVALGLMLCFQTVLPDVWAASASVNTAADLETQLQNGAGADKAPAAGNGKIQPGGVARTKP